MNARQETQETATVGTQSYDAMWAEFAASETPDEIPAGFLSAREYRDRFFPNQTAAAVSMRLMKKAEHGELKMLVLKVARADGIVDRVRYFLPTPPAKSPRKLI